MDSNMDYNMNFSSDEDGDNNYGEELLYSKEFVNKFYEFKTYQQATGWILKWYKEMKHNTTEFTNEFPALIDCGSDYRLEKLKKLQTNPEQPTDLSTFPKDQLMA